MELARALGITGWTLNSYWKRPGRPKDHADGKARYNIQEYRDWISDFKSAHNFGNGRNASDGWHASERDKAIIEKNRVATEAAIFKLQKDKGLLVPRSEVKRQADTSGELLKRELYKAAEHELPPRLEMLKASEIKKVLVGKINDILDAFINALREAANAGSAG
jgi:hypothetical protein